MNLTQVIIVSACLSVSVLSAAPISFADSLSGNSKPASESGLTKVKLSINNGDQQTESGISLKKQLNPKHLYLRSSTALIVDEHDGTILYEK